MFLFLFKFFMIDVDLPITLYKANFAKSFLFVWCGAGRKKNDVWYTVIVDRIFLSHQKKFIINFIFVAKSKKARGSERGTYERGDPLSLHRIDSSVCLSFSRNFFEWFRNKLRRGARKRRVKFMRNETLRKSALRIHIYMYISPLFCHFCHAHPLAGSHCNSSSNWTSRTGAPNSQPQLPFLPIILYGNLPPTPSAKQIT